MHVLVRLLGLMLISVQTVSAAAGDSASRYPNKPVRLIVPFAPGGSSDVVMRIITAKLFEVLGEQFVLDNRPGAGGLIGGDIVVKAIPDGYTLLLANPGPSVGGPLLTKSTPYKVTEFTPIVFLGYMPLILVANPAFAPNNPTELLAYLNANPGKVNWGSSGYASSTHIGQMLFKMATRTDSTHVAYKGSGPAFPDLIGGRIQLMYASTLSAETQIKAGRMKVIGVASMKRLAIMPNVPTLTESGIKDAEALSWYGISGPLKMEREIVGRLNTEINRILRIPDVRKHYDELGFEVTGGAPADFAKFVNREVEQLRKLIAVGALRPES